MKGTHYDTLGLPRGATSDEVRSAYRKIVLVHHPDRSRDPRSKAIFLAATEAYDVLSDSAARLAYDKELELRERRATEILEDARRAEERRAAQATRSGWSTPSAPVTVPAYDIKEEIARLHALFARGNHAEADRVARRIAEAAPRNPVPYAVLGDLARLAGNLNEAAKMYAYASQFEPSNPVYQRRYEQLLESAQVVEGRSQRTTLQQADRNVLAPGAVALWVLIAAVAFAVMRGPQPFGRLAWIATWPVELPILLLLTGVVEGALLAGGNLLDRFEGVAVTATGRAGPIVLLSLIALVNFWAAVALYLVFGLAARAWNFSVSRLFAALTCTLLVFGVAAYARPGTSPAQTFAWGGNLLFVGAVLGWLAADLRRA